MIKTVLKSNILYSLLAYFIGFKSLQIYLWHPKTDNIQLLVHPCIMVYLLPLILWII